MVRPLSKEERVELRKLLKAVELFRAIDPDMPAQQMTTLLTIALHEGLPQKEIAARVGIATSSASRNVSSLSKRDRMGKAGHDLVSAVEDPMERRRKIHTLTPKGRVFIFRLLGKDDA